MSYVILGMCYGEEQLVPATYYHHEEVPSMTLHEVWRSNLEEEFAHIRQVVEHYPYVAMDTEYPGLVVTPTGQFQDKSDFNYQQVRVNVNCLKLIQAGFTFVNEAGELPPGNDVWQFNFHFDPLQDVIAHDSGELLRNAGIDFELHQAEGISMTDFGELLTTSGLLADEKVTWITYHGSFDFGYLIKAILRGELPVEREEFLRYHRAFFPHSYDIKMLIREPGFNSIMLKGGLQDVADQLQVPRVGQMHQAGSDSLLTAQTFFKLREHFFGWDRWGGVTNSMRGHMFSLGGMI